MRNYRTLNHAIRLYGKKSNLFILSNALLQRRKLVTENKKADHPLTSPIFFLPISTRYLRCFSNACKDLRSQETGLVEGLLLTATSCGSKKRQRRPAE